MKKCSGVILFVFILIALCNGWIRSIVDFILNICIWLSTLNMTQSSVSFLGEIFVKVATIVISYSAVGVVFRTIGWFDSNIMKGAYFVISTLVSFGLCYMVMIFETHLLMIAIIAGILLIIVTMACILISVLTRKEAYEKIKAPNGKKGI